MCSKREGCWLVAGLHCSPVCEFHGTPAQHLTLQGRNGHPLTVFWAVLCACTFNQWPSLGAQISVFVLTRLSTSYRLAVCRCVAGHRPCETLHLWLRCTQLVLHTL